MDELYSQAEDLGVRVPLDMGACGLQEVAYFHQHSDEVDFVFVDHPSYHRAGALPRHQHAGAAIRLPCLLAYGAWAFNQGLTMQPIGISSL